MKIRSLTVAVAVVSLASRAKAWNGYYIVEQTADNGCTDTDDRAPILSIIHDFLIEKVDPTIVFLDNGGVSGIDGYDLGFATNPCKIPGYCATNYNTCLAIGCPSSSYRRNLGKITYKKPTAAPVKVTTQSVTPAPIAPAPVAPAPVAPAPVAPAPVAPAPVAPAPVAPAPVAPAPIAPAPVAPAPVAPAPVAPAPVAPAPVAPAPTTPAPVAPAPVAPAPAPTSITTLSTGYLTNATDISVQGTLRLRTQLVTNNTYCNRSLLTFTFEFV